MYRACSINIKCTAIVREPGQSQVSLLEERRGEEKGKKKEKEKKKKEAITRLGGITMWHVGGF